MQSSFGSRIGYKECGGECPWDHNSASSKSGFWGYWSLYARTENWILSDRKIHVFFNKFLFVVWICMIFYSIDPNKLFYHSRSGTDMETSTRTRIGGPVSFCLITKECFPGCSQTDSLRSHCSEVYYMSIIRLITDQENSITNLT